MSDLPKNVLEEAVRLTRRARRAIDDAEAAAYREARDATLADHGYRARLRSDDDGPVLVCFPADWVEDGVVDPARIDDLSRAFERAISSDDGSDDWAAIEACNRAIAFAVKEGHGPVHGATAEAFADFMGNHYAERIENAGHRECQEFLEEYFPRNAWPTDEQRAVAKTSLQLVFETAGADAPFDPDEEDGRR